MNAADVVGYVTDGAVYCYDDVSEEQEQLLNEELTPIFAGNEGWENLTCEECERTLGDVAGIGD